MFCITGIQLSADISLTVYSLYRARKQRDSVVFKCINISDINIEKIFFYVSSTTVNGANSCSVQRELYQILRESICIKQCFHSQKNNFLLHNTKFPFFPQIFLPKISKYPSIFPSKCLSKLTDPGSIINIKTLVLKHIF